MLALCDCVGEDIDGYEILKSVMRAGKTTLDLINLSGNRISTGGDTFISNFLAGNHKLETLKLSNNRLNDNDAMMIASALKHNKLRSLFIGSNNLTNEGWKTLHKAVYDKTSLNAAADTNHTCNIDFPRILDYDNVRENGTSADGKHFIDPKWVKHKKIYSILSSRNRNGTNVEHLEDVPIELLPNILSSVQYMSDYFVGMGPSKDNREVKPLSLVYELCRHWDEALAVFELLSSSACGLRRY